MTKTTQQDGKDEDEEYEDNKQDGKDEEEEDEDKQQDGKDEDEDEDNNQGEMNDECSKHADGDNCDDEEIDEENTVQDYADGILKRFRMILLIKVNKSVYIRFY